MTLRQNSCILVAEDDVVNQKVAQKILEKAGYQVHIAGNGEEAWNYLLSGQPVDLVLMDVKMPVMDGVMATHRIRESGRDFQHLPIIAMTAYAHPSDREKFLAAGMDDYISKPVDKQDLLNLLARYLG
ncbi:MAG: response regulator [Desulfovermiculus sp.]